MRSRLAQKPCAYVIRAVLCGLFKIGKARDLAIRFKALRLVSPGKLEVEQIIIGRDERHAHDIEERPHRDLAQYRRQGEWFDLPPESLSTLTAVNLDPYRLGYELADGTGSGLCISTAG